MKKDTSIKDTSINDQGEELYKGWPVCESGSKWAIAQCPEGYLRHYVGQPDRVFRSLAAALDDCGIY